VKPPPEFLPVTSVGDKLSNHEYEKWVSKEAQVLSYLFTSLPQEIFAQVSMAETAAKL
jgi:hypothetical protein